MPSVAICGRLEDARQAFDKICKPKARQVLEKMHNPSALLWNAMIIACAKNKNDEGALELYHQMQSMGFEPDEFTFPLGLKACADLSALQEGKEIHHQIDGCGFDSDVFVATAMGMCMQNAEVLTVHGKCLTKCQKEMWWHGMQ